MRLRSLSTQTDIDINSEFVNPFYQDRDEDDDSGIERPPAINLESLKSNGIVNSGGTIKHNGKKKKRADSVPDCFKPESIGYHKSKGGDGFEAWKGNRKVIKKMKLGVKKEEQKIVPRDGKYAQPFQRGIFGSGTTYSK